MAVDVGVIVGEIAALHVLQNLHGCRRWRFVLNISSSLSKSCSTSSSGATISEVLPCGPTILEVLASGCEMSIISHAENGKS